MKNDLSNDTKYMHIEKELTKLLYQMQQNMHKISPISTEYCYGYERVSKASLCVSLVAFPAGC